MESPFLWLAIGLFAGACASPVLLAGHILKERMTVRTRELLCTEASAAQAVSMLVAEGNDPEMDARADVRRVLAHAAHERRRQRRPARLEGHARPGPLGRGDVLRP